MADSSKSSPNPILEVSQIRSLLEGASPTECRSVIDSLIEAFKQEADQQVAILCDCDRDTDPTRIEYLAHSLSGSSGNLGMTRLSLFAKAIELNAQSSTFRIDLNLSRELRALYEASLHAFETAFVR